MRFFADERQDINCEFIVVNIFSSHASDSEPIHMVFEVVPTWIYIQLSKILLKHDANMLSFWISVLTRNSQNIATYSRNN